VLLISLVKRSANGGPRRLIPENGRLEIELAGDLASLLDLAADSKQPATARRDGLQATLVAGVGFEPTTFRL
jgi:site-specific DNA recombinase